MEGARINDNANKCHKVVSSCKGQVDHDNDLPVMVMATS
jgi:hypothetical protein